MKKVVITPAKSFSLGTSEIAPDKSISHRSVMFAMLSDGVSEINLTTQVADLNILAKQLKAYSKVDANNQASLDGSSLKEDGVEASIKFSIKNLSNSTDKKGDNSVTINK